MEIQTYTSQLMSTTLSSSKRSYMPWFQAKRYCAHAHMLRSLAVDANKRISNDDGNCIFLMVYQRFYTPVHQRNRCMFLYCN
mmetsp:Transcript_36179/g.48487  ORF Transcript_36179/g.48487 Transcript_36179/m.48487 type:complete len:82 (-) Transcript_36179:917-1162(-)